MSTINWNDPTATNTEVGDILKQIGLNSDTATQNFIAYELEETDQGFNPWASSGDTALGGFKFPANFNHDDFEQALSLAQQWAQSVGFRYYPSAKMIWSIYQQGITNLQQASQYFYSKLSPTDQSKMPWAASGATQDTWLQDTHSIDQWVVDNLGQGTWQSAGLDAGLVNTALRDKWTTQTLSDYLQKDPATMQKYGWIKYGYNYSSWQQYLEQNKATLESRYGRGNATTQNALANLAAPLQSTQGQGQAFQMGNNTSAPMGMAASRSSIR